MEVKGEYRGEIRSLEETKDKEHGEGLVIVLAQVEADGTRLYGKLSGTGQKPQGSACIQGDRIGEKNGRYISES
jgi:hypothetical protein